MPELDLNYQANTYAGMVGKSRLMHERVFKPIDQAAPIDITVLILGETGTGKELTSRALHNNSRRRDNPYVPVHCAAIPKDLIESELYGHELGAFTGAVKERKGKFRQAHEGTIFLDEIGSMHIDQQPRLLRVLEDMVIVPVGSDRPQRVDTRVVAATNQDLYGAVREHTFRSDLYYRLAAVVISIPPLRERVGDIPMLIKYFMDKYQRLYGREVKPFTPREYIEYIGYSWPGNVRELENTVKSLIVTGADKLERLAEAKQISALILSGIVPVRYAPELETDRVVTEEGMPTKPWKELWFDLQAELITKALIKNKGNKRATARELGMKRTTLVDHIDRIKARLGLELQPGTEQDSGTQYDEGKVVRFKKS